MFQMLLMLGKLVGKKTLLKIRRSGRRGRRAARREFILGCRLDRGRAFLPIPKNRAVLHR